MVDLPLLLAVRAREPLDTKKRRWHERFVQRATDAVTILRFDDGDLLFSNQQIGRYRFVEIAEATADHAAAPWFRLDAPCRFVGPVEGFIALDYWPDDMFSLGQLLVTAHGYLARVEPPEAFELIVEERFPLGDAGSSHGFHDGDFFLDDDAYAAYVRGTILDAVHELGLDVELFTGGTSHNPHRISTFLGDARTAYATFQRHADRELRLWGYRVDAEARLLELVSG